jgi:hypothetical protein
MDCQRSFFMRIEITVDDVVVTIAGYLENSPHCIARSTIFTPTVDSLYLNMAPSQRTHYFRERNTLATTCRSSSSSSDATDLAVAGGIRDYEWYRRGSKDVMSTQPYL